MGPKSVSLIGVLLLGCGNAEQEKLDSAQHLWLAVRPASYETVVRRSCFCGDVDTYRVQVQGATVTSAVRLTPDGVETTVEPSAYQDWFTVEGLFSAVQEAIRDRVDHLSTNYDPALGHPVQVDIDPHAGAVDDETTYETARLDALP
jgi:hypothetical protein